MMNYALAARWRTLETLVGFYDTCCTTGLCGGGDLGGGGGGWGAVCAVVLKTLISATCGTTLNTRVPASRVEKGKTRGSNTGFGR